MYQKKLICEGVFWDKCKETYFKTDQNFAVSDRQSFTYIVQFMKYRKNDGISAACTEGGR